MPVSAQIKPKSEHDRNRGYQTSRGWARTGPEVRFPFPRGNAPDWKLGRACLDSRQVWMYQLRLETAPGLIRFLPGPTAAQLVMFIGVIPRKDIPSVTAPLFLVFVMSFLFSSPLTCLSTTPLVTERAAGYVHGDGETFTATLINLGSL